MQNYRKIIESKRYTFSDTSFDKLMQKRIYKVLLVCNAYDSFMLEEDGRIDEKVFNEYYSLNLRYPPMFLQANTIRDAYRIMEEDSIDLIITMLTVESVIAFKLAKDIKSKYPNKPIVVLTPFSREVSLMLEKEDVSAIDYVFCWLGNTDILLAIIKLIEDQMNLKLDVEDSGVQAILLVEDSVRYYSSYLPNIYKIVFQQSKRSMTEGVNEHQRMMVMRGRPKIILATNYEQAITLFKRYKDNLIGVISDISFKREGLKDAQAGIKICKEIRAQDPFMPFLLQSSDIENAQIAKELGVVFLNKYSKSLSIELRNYIITHLAFGDFIFRDPDTLQEICRATDLRSLQEKILKVPDRCIEFHVKQNHFSKWMNARALFSIARMLKYLTYDYFNSIDEVRSFIYDVIDTYRQYRGKGVIAKFEGKNFDEYYNFSRVGEGSVGGKARGLAFIDMLIKKYNLSDKYPNVLISIPRTVVLSSDVFDEFMENNNLYKVALSQADDQEILQAFVSARLPSQVLQELYAFISIANNPIAIRSSSKLEDSHYQPFAGVYSTYMIPCLKNDSKGAIKLLTEAIKSVYASVFFKSSKAYMTATSNVIDEEKMGIILQEVCGTKQDNYFYPTFSGVARSINFYPIPPETPKDGIVNIAYGLGKYIVNGGQTMMFSPMYPKKVIQLSSPETAMRDAQKQFYALDLNPDTFTPSVDDGINIALLDIKKVFEKPSSRFLLSTYDYQNNVLRDGYYEGGMKVLTFAGILNHNVFPLADILNELLSLTQREIGNPVEIEFAVNLDVPKGQPYSFSYLQVRPIVENKEIVDIDIKEFKEEDVLIFSKSSLGNGIINNVCDFVYVRPDSFKPANTLKIAEQIEVINNQMIAEDKNYVLVGPGRWGSSDPWLGIPVKWSQISNARVIVESGLNNFRIDPSQGTHFFQNLTSFRIGYFTINTYINDGIYDVEFLDKCPSVFENEYVRHVRFSEPLSIMIDGKKNMGIIKKPAI
ncbi:MAG: phosphoenolpyruvate synthase [Bacteroidetes bacterium HGW-Bacteroidetes-21]|nr:MAG: phosphoenolpyruvate synthase [Bacteroidetes bacterium HGW-Bacteroidetes-21]